MSIIAAMFVMGLLLGFVGAGGAGMVVSILTAIFGIPIHIALGTSLGAMVFTTLSGTYSHLQEKNIVIKCGLAIGASGGIGAFLGAKVATFLPDGNLRLLTGSMMLLSAALLALRLYCPQLIASLYGKSSLIGGLQFYATAGCVGLLAGFMSGAFGIGGLPYIQLGLLIFFGLSLQEAAGTGMLVTVPIALMGGVGYLLSGHLDLHLLAQVVSGLVTGTYIGAKFTRRLSPAILRATLIIMPVTGALLLIVPVAR